MAKFNIIVHPSQELTGYTNVQLAQLNTDISDGEAEEVLCTNIIPYVQNEYLDGFLQAICRKIELGGEIIFNIVDSYAVCHAVSLYTIPVEEAVKLLPTPTWVTVESLSKKLQSFGMKILKKRLEGFNGCVIATR